MTVTPLSISKRCVYCKAADQPLAGDGFRKRCADERGCRERVAAQNPNPMPPITPRRPSLARGSAAGSGVPGHSTPAEVLVEMLLEHLHLGDLSGPVAFGDTLTLPIQILQGRYVSLGKSGCGKSNASAVIFEACIANRVPVLLFDLLGNQSGLRRPGSGAAVAVPILGGDYGDMPLHLDDAIALAQLFAEGHSMILDLSHFSVEDQQWFAAAFFKESLRVHRIPAHVIIEEAEILAPSFSRSKSHFASQGAVTFWARKIRNFGIGWTFSTQRPQLLHSDVVDSANVFIPMLSTGDNAQKAIGKEAKSRVGRIIADAVLSELGRLRQGEAWLIPGPGWLGDDEQPIAPIKFRWRWRQTFDSTAVPKIGEVRAEPPPMIPVDLRAFAKLKAAIATSAAERRTRKRAS